MKTKLLILSIAALCFSVAPAMADFIAPTGPVTFGWSWDGGYSLQNVLDSITVIPPSPGPGSSVNVLNDTILDSWDSLWQIGGQGQSAATLVIEIAGYAPSNIFGIYDAANPANLVPIFTGGATAGARATVTIETDGSVWVVQTYPVVGGGDTTVDFAGNLFGFYLNTPNGTFYSDTLLNTDNFDHLRAYQGKGIDTIQVGTSSAGLWQTDTYALAWEDLLNGGDQDYQDMVLMVESLMPVPVPAAVLLGILGLGVAGWKLRKYA